MTTQNRQKSNAKKIKNKKTTIQMLIPDNYKFTYSDYSNACIHTYRDYQWCCYEHVEMYESRMNGSSRINDNVWDIGTICP